MGGAGKGLMGYRGSGFRRSPIRHDSRSRDDDTEMQTPDVEAERLRYVRTHVNASNRDRMTRDYIAQHGHEPWRRPRGRGRGRVIHDRAESSAGPTAGSGRGRVTVDRGEPSAYHQSPQQQEFHRSPYQQEQPQMQPEEHDGRLLTEFDSHICSKILDDPVSFSPTFLIKLFLNFLHYTIEYLLWT